MAEYLRPGVFIEEIERGPRPIEGVPTSTAAFLGETERGPIRPRLVTSYGDYQRWFGGVFNPERFMPYAAAGFFENGGRRLYVSRIVSNDAETASAEFGDFDVTAAGAGSWGNRVWVRIEASTTKAVPPNSPAGTAPVPVGFRMLVAYWASTPAGFQAFDPVRNPRQLPRPAVIEDFDDLVLQEASPDFYEKRVNGNSALVQIKRRVGVDSLPALDTDLLLEDGTDGAALGVDDFNGLPLDNRTDLQGLAALETDPYRDVALVYAPFHAGLEPLLGQAVITHCENLRFRFAVVDTAKSQSDVAAVDPRTTITDSTYAATYFPWIKISDPQSGVLRLVPPGGHALGVYARTDVERGVFKAPANEIARGVVDLEFDITDGQQEQLNPRGVNVIRRFPGRGIRVWGARTLSSNGLWKYVSVRRLFIFLERSIYENTQWVVFEPNDDRLWARVKDTLRLFLRSQWRNGALFGRTEEEAFFITCDRTTMTQDDILNGRLICEIGIAPVRPAEFVVFRVFQHTAEAQR
ncbi:MAG: phage tail sheath family protein [Rhodobacter sp.]|nr:phage tail sheath family protein [Rhodobacter sp.]MCA3456675.1 phage tail sheath family protein [Rhodobacter sp.]